MEQMRDSVISSLAAASTCLLVCYLTAVPLASSGCCQQANSTAPTQPGTWLVRDPVSGRVFRQQIVSVQVPTTQWQYTPVPTTVMESQVVTKKVPQQRTLYVPQTRYVMQPKVRGWWNPVGKGVNSYDFVPVTSWQATSQTIEQPVQVQEWVAKQQVVYVPRLVSAVSTQQQLVQSEVPSSTHPTSSTSGSQLATSWTSTGLRAINSAPLYQPAYTATLQASTTRNASMEREAIQVGMSPTILR